MGEWSAGSEEAGWDQVPMPVQRVRVGDGPWRGKTFFDTRQPVRSISSVLLESGPLRTVVRYQAVIGSSQSYAALLTFDAASDFIEIDETFSADRGDQIVWDFAGEDLPDELHRLDSSAGYTSQTIGYFFDRRLARLAGWNQYSQLHDFSDGYALTFPKSEDVIGLVALRGGDWQGNSHNFLEAWVRRWFPDDPSSRRLVPPEAKADGAPSPEQVPGRPVNLHEPHFSIEGWLHQGRRTFALMLTTKDQLRPEDWNAQPSLGHFETKPDRERYRQQQSLLRRIHTQRGLFPLADQLALACEWPMELIPPAIADLPAPWDRPDAIRPERDHPMSPAQRVEEMLQFLAARVYGFWEGSGSAYTNAVVSRRLAHDVTDWEWLVAHGHLTPEQISQSRAWFAFLTQLFASDHYYPGEASMNMGAPGQSLEPAMAGMANQNFFTDVFNLPGIAAQVFHAHPCAGVWRGRFAEMWQRQLQYHVYPESGVWEESHTYFHHVLHTVIPTLERRRDDGVGDGFADPSFQHVVASLLKMLTPRDRTYDDHRHVVALGDHGVDLKDIYRPLYKILAGHVADSNPGLAGHLSWAYREMGGEGDLPVAPSPIPWRNEYVQGLGFFFRGQDARGESLLVLRCGNAWAHHHNDDGSLQFFAAGRAWVVDSAFSYPQKNGARKIRADGHSRWAPRDLDPLNCLWQFNRGWISQHAEDAAFPYAMAFTPTYMAEASWQQYTALRVPILHWRCVVQLAASSYLILDRTNLDIPQVMRFHVPVEASVLLEDSPAMEVGPSLRIQSVCGLGAPQVSPQDFPTQAPSKFATREVGYRFEGDGITACVLSVEGASLPLEIKQEEGSVSLCGDGFSARLTVVGERVTITNRETGVETEITFA